MITEWVPGSYVTHDQLHIRGGHQTSWLIDGVPVPNTNIASNLGPQFDPKDVDYIEISRGGYGAELGDRTYGVFNVVPRTGFERQREAELVLSAGNFYQTNDQLSFGDHTERLAWYASLNGNRSDLGIQTPVPQVVHDRTNGYGGFGSVIYNLTPADQLRAVTSLRRDYYQIPYDPNPNDIENNPINGHIPPLDCAMPTAKPTCWPTSAGCTPSTRMRSSRPRRSSTTTSPTTRERRRSAGQHAPGAQLRLRRRPAQP